MPCSALAHLVNLYLPKLACKSVSIQRLPGRVNSRVSTMPVYFLILNRHSSSSWDIQLLKNSLTWISTRQKLQLRRLTVTFYILASFNAWIMFAYHNPNHIHTILFYFCTFTLAFELFDQTFISLGILLWCSLNWVLLCLFGFSFNSHPL